jgi:hypothetical protein
MMDTTGGDRYVFYISIIPSEADLGFCEGFYKFYV